MGRVLVQQPGTNTTKALSETLPKNVIIVDEDLKELRLHDGVTPGGKIIGKSAGSGVPVGTIIPFAGNSVPQGYLLCDGSAISRTDYASLFAVIGTIYGAGDGNSTFNLPNMGGSITIKTMVPNGNNVSITHDNSNDQTIAMSEHGYVVARLYDTNGNNTQWNVMSHNLGWSYQAWNQTGDSYLTTPTKGGQLFRIWKNRGTIQDLYFVNGTTYNIFRGRKMCIKYI